MQVDGRLDDEAWEAAEVISEFYQRSTRDVVEASERTEVRVLYDDRFLYIGVWALGQRTRQDGDQGDLP